MYRIGDIVELADGAYFRNRMVIPPGSIFKVVDVSMDYNLAVLQVSPNRYGKDYQGWSSNCYGASGKMFWGVSFDCLKKKCWRMDV